MKIIDKNEFLEEFKETFDGSRDFKKNNLSGEGKFFRSIDAAKDSEVEGKILIGIKKSSISRAVNYFYYEEKPKETIKISSPLTPVL
jgi:hypothetical protein